MSDSDRGSEAWLLALLLAAVASPASFVLGMGATASVLRWLDPPTSGEGVMGIGFAAYFVGAPLGIVIGSAVIMALAVWYGARWRWPAVAAAVLALGAASGLALRLIDAV